MRTLNGHKRGIACLQYRDRLVVSGSSDNTIRYVLEIQHVYGYLYDTDVIVSNNVLPLKTIYSIGMYVAICVC